MKSLVGPHGLIALVVLAAPLAIGATHPVTRGALAGVVALALVWRVSVKGRPLHFDVMAWALLIACGWTLAQWLPMPAGWVEASGSPTASLHAQAATALGVSSEAVTHSLSVDRGSTADMFMYLFAALGGYLIVLNSRRSQQRVAIKAIALGGLLVTTIGLAHKALRAETLFGVYEPNLQLASAPLPTTLLNGNHAATFLIIAASSAVALAMTSKSRQAPARYWALAIFCGAGVLVTGSIAGIGLMAGLGLVIALRRWLLTLDAGQRVRVVFAVSLPVVIAAVVYGVVESSDVNVARRWTVGWNVAQDHWSVGVGAGAFPMVAPQHQVEWANGLLTFAHNGLLQSVAEWGMPVTLILVCSMAWAMASTMWRSRVTEHLVVALLGVGAAVGANLVEFSLWIPGVGLPALILFAWPAAESRPRSSRTSRASKGQDAGRLLDNTGGATTPSRPPGGPHEAKLSIAWRVAPLGLIAGLVAIGVPGVTQSWAAAHEKARAHVAAGDMSAEGWATFAASHPSDYYVWLHAAKSAAKRGDEGLQKVVAHALRLSPRHPETLKLCGLHETSGAALDCLELLVRVDQRSRFRAARVAMARNHSEPDFLQRFAARSGPAAMAVADVLRVGDSIATYEKALRWAFREHPGDATIARRLVGLWLDRADRRPELNAASLTLFTRADATEGALVQARLRRLAYLSLGAVTQTVKNDVRAAAHAFEAAAREVPEEALLPLKRAARAWLTLNETERVKVLISKLEALGEAGSKPHIMSSVHRLKSRIAEIDGDLQGAIHEIRRAMAYDKRSSKLHARLAHLFRKTGSKRLAERANARAKQLGHNPEKPPAAGESRRR